VSPAHLPYGKRASPFGQAWKGGRHPTLVELQWQPLPTRRSNIRLQLTRLNRRHAHGQPISRTASAPRPSGRHGRKAGSSQAPKPQTAAPGNCTAAFQSWPDLWRRNSLTGTTSRRPSPPPPLRGPCAHGGHICSSMAAVCLPCSTCSGATRSY
jgi:hypothetical protein